jgi:hypothetical protein
MTECTYFPAFHETWIDCNRCELVDWSEGLTYGKSKCGSYGAHQRNRRDFTYTSRRCPKLPDMRGFVHESQRENQRNAYPIIHAESNGEEVFLNLSIPGQKKLRRVYETRSGYFYFKTKDEEHGYVIKRVIWIGCNMSRQNIKEYMERFHADYCLFNCVISDVTV